MRATVKELLRSGLSPRELVEEAIKKLSPRCIRYFFDLFREKNEMNCEILTGFLKGLVTRREEEMEGIIATFIKYGADPNGLWRRPLPWTGEERGKPYWTVRPLNAMRSSGNPIVRGMLDIPEDVHRHIFSFLLERHGKPKPMIPLSAISFVAFSDTLKKLAYIQYVRSPRKPFSVMVRHNV
jgi:hypothetical protein